MKPSLLKYLVDPQSGDSFDLAVDEAEGTEILSGSLVSRSGRIVQIRSGIPRFDGEGYANSFGVQWNRFRSTQLDSVSGRSTSADRFREEVSSRVPSLNGRVVVDVGCGSGRFAEIALELGATVIGVDLSDAVDATYASLGRHPRMHVIQADARRLPLSFSDIAGLYSIGVLQHTPNPYITAACLVRNLAPGSWFAFTAYGRGPLTTLHSKYLVRPLTTRMDPSALLAVLRVVVPVLGGPISILPANSMLSRLIRFALPIAIYPEAKYPTRSARWEEAILDSLDMLSPHFDHPLDAEKLVGLLAQSAHSVTLHSARPLQVSGVR